MSGQAKVFTRRAAGLRKKYGSRVRFEGIWYGCNTKLVAGNLTGLAAVPIETMKVLVASAESRVFHLTPLRFAPYTGVLHPRENQTLEWNGWRYLITHVSHNQIGRDTHSIDLYCLRDTFRGLPE